MPTRSRSTPLLECTDLALHGTQTMMRMAGSVRRRGSEGDAHFCFIP